MAGLWYILAETLMGVAAMPKRRGHAPPRATVGIILCAGGLVVAVPSAVRLAFIAPSGGLVVALVIGVLAIAGGVAVLAGGER